ncbi:MAG TPA: Holliday junction branch migration protein RuvA [Gammaproteobacteria bacterium]|nr:Holliday junction branch migration protein RuvA [Gammaproteobacteria bacterium]
MIGRLWGVLVEKRPPWLLLDVNGVGYEVEAPMSTFYDLPAVSEKVTLYTHLAVKDDAHSLYGFATEQERTLFRSLIRVSGIGPRIALGILSGIRPDDFIRCIEQQDIPTLTRLPGIGKKTAERLLIEMRDRIKTLGVAPLAATGGMPALAVANDPQSEAISALIALGYKPAESARLVQAVGTDDKTTEQIIRLALQRAVR